MTRVLVTGAGGFIGAHLVRHLLRNTDWEVIGLDSFRHRGKTDRLAPLFANMSVYTVTHDLRAPISNQLAAAIGDIDYVVNLAAGSHVDESIASPRDFVENNVASMLTMLEWAREAKPKIVLHMSTDEVYGPRAGTGRWIEGAPHKPSSPYAASKAAQEDICWAYRWTYGVPVVVANSMNVFGPYQGSEKFIPKVVRMVLAGETVKIHSSPGKVPGTRTYLPAPDLCEALLLLLVDTPLHSGKAPRYNIAGDTEMSNLELAKLIASILRHELKYELVSADPARPGCDLRYGLDGSLLRSLGWRPKTDVRTYLEHTVKWYKENPAWLLP